jgi:hypothetical protein
MGVSTRTTMSAPASGMDLVDVAVEAQELRGKGHAIDDELTALAREVSACAAVEGLGFIRRSSARACHMRWRVMRVCTGKGSWGVE